MSEMNHVWRLAAHPVGMVQESDFSFHEEPMPTPGEGEALIRNLYLSLDPAMRAWITGRRSYVEGVRIGDRMRGGCVGEIVESNLDGFAPGEIVVGQFDWQEFALSSNEGPLSINKVPPGVPLPLALGPLGITGVTAYFGLLDVGQPKEGETVVVSGAAGATGSVAAQIAKIKGCRVIGIAGGKEKCGWLMEKAGLDGAIDYKSENVRSRMKELCPKGVGVYFDNVGGEILDAALENLALRGRVVLCGGISQYNATELPPGPAHYLNMVPLRGRMEGFIVFDYFPRIGEAFSDLSQWVMGGKIQYEFDIQEGLENAPKTLIRLFEGKNLGKQLLKIAEPTGG